MKGIDTCAHIQDALLLKERGIAFVCRYLVPLGYAKALTADEAAGILRQGLGLLLCWELDANRAAEGARAGTQDGERARRCAAELCVPQSATIYFAVDYVPPQRDYDAIEAYFRATSHYCAPYGCGIYGPFDIVEEMVRRIPTLYVWQCVGGSGGRISASADVYQYQGQHGDEAKALGAQLGYAVDLNTCEDLRKAGMWLPEEKQPWYTDTVAWALKEGVATEARPTDYAIRAEVMQMIRNYNRRFEAEDDKTASGLLTD